MKLHEQRNHLAETQSDALDFIQTSLEYLSSSKFQNGENWIRTWEVQNMLLNIRTKLDTVMEG